MSDDLVNRLREGPMSFHEARIKMDAAATALEEARAEIEAANYAHARMRDRAHAAESELSTLRDMLVLCGELGGMGKDETPAAYLRRLIDEVAGVESLRARVREVVGPFARLDTSHTDDIDDSALVFENEGGNIVLGHLRAACQLMEEVK